MRDRLIELLTETFDEQYKKRMLITPQHTADHLLANGVMLSTEDPVQLMTLAVEKIGENMEKFFEKIDHPIGKTIVAAIVKGVLISAIEEATQELKEEKG